MCVQNAVALHFKGLTLLFFRMPIIPPFHYIISSFKKYLFKIKKLFLCLNLLISVTADQCLCCLATLCKNGLNILHRSRHSECFNDILCILCFFFYYKLIYII